MESYKKLFNRHVSVLLLLISLFGIISCKFFESLDETNIEESKIEQTKVSIDSLSLGKQQLAIKVGGMDYVSVSIKPQKEQKNARLSWSYDHSIIECNTSSSWGVTIKALQEGQTNLICSCEGYDASCLITVSGYEIGYETTAEPYIYSNTSILQTAPGVTEKVFVSLYGGDANDIDGYTWTIDNPSVASIQPTGQYCLITAKDSGYARIKVTHNKAKYPYYMGIYVFEDATKVTYITTQNNIITMNQTDSPQTVTVNLINGKESSYNKDFKWEIVNDGNTQQPVSIDYNSNTAVITPLRSGSCTIRVTHPDAVYPLDILCRVITIVKNVYILPDTTVITLDGEEQKTVTSSLENIKEGEYSVADYEYRLDDYNVAEIINSVENQVTLRGKANGSCKLLISHPKSAYTREVLIIVTGQLTDAVDASCYITTNQNYIRTKVGADTIPLNISLKGGEDGDEKDFVWTVKSEPKDGVSKVIELETTDGSVLHSRAAYMTYTYGTSYITPNAEGTATILLSHPKIAYPTEVLVKVLSADAILDEPLYFVGDGLVRIINGNSYDYTVELKGKNKAESDKQNISWSAEDSRISLTSNGEVVQITAPAYGTGCTVSYITASHAKCEAEKRILVMTADDEQTLNSMKALYSDKLYYNFEVGGSAICVAQAVGFKKTVERNVLVSEDDEGEKYEKKTFEIDETDFSKATWTVQNPAIAYAEKVPDNPLNCVIKGLKSGTTKVTVTFEDTSCDFNITVYPKGTVNVEPEVYFTTKQNVITLGKKGDSASVDVSAINLSNYKYSNITWENENEDIVTVISNGTTATVTAKAEGTAVIKITHPESQNTLKIYVRVGSEYVMPEVEPVVYISSQDVITMLKDSQPQQLQATLVNFTGNDTSGFTFSIDNEEVARITTQTKSGIAYIKPISSGQAQVTIRHSATEITKQVLIMVGNSEEELAGFTYLTTNQNVVAIGEGTTKNISVSIKNSEDIVLDGYVWSSSNPSVVDVTPNGATAVLTGNSIGTSIITVTNSKCKYPLTIIAQCIDPIAASANPYIQLTSSVLTLSVSTKFTDIVADLVGGDESDYSDFIWTSKDSSICAVYGQNQIGKARALKEGTTYITVEHPKSHYSAQILVVCDKKVESDCYISVPTSILNMKPTDSAQTITASLINGDATDKYNFHWSLDVYDVIDFQYSANVCTISPKQAGSCTITLSHPKAAYDQQIIVTIQEYNEFKFPKTNMTITQGEANFITMEVPVTKVATHVEYSVDKASICSISGTKAVAQIQGIESGTTTVRAKLVASSTGVVQAQSEMLIYVKERPVNQTYLTSSSTIYTVNKGKSQTLSASLSGSNVTMSDSANIKWTTSDSDVIQVTGINSNGVVTGSQIYITALKAGEALITCSHEKAASDLQFYVVVPGNEDKIVTLNKSFITMTKGSNGTTIKANIENAENSSDYYDLIWTCENVSGEPVEIARVMGKGQTVTIYPVNVGEATLRCSLPNLEKVASCTIKVEATKSFVFENNAKTVAPFHKAKVKYTVSPPDSILNWTTTQQEDFFTYHDCGCDQETGIGYVEIEGLYSGSGVIACVTDKGAKGTINVKIDWGYKFNIDKPIISGIPDLTYTINYGVSPADAKIEVVGGETLFRSEIIRDPEKENNGIIKLTPLRESKGEEIIIQAINPYEDNKVIGRETVKVRFMYENIKPHFTITEDINYQNKEDAYYSGYESGNLIIGDGEQVTFAIDYDQYTFLEPEISIKKINIPNELKNVIEVKDNLNKNGTITICHKEDIIAPGYRIIEGYRPTYNESTDYPDGTPIKFEDFTNTAWANDYWSNSWDEHVSTDKWGHKHYEHRGEAKHAVYYSFRNNYMNTEVQGWQSGRERYRYEFADHNEYSHSNIAFYQSYLSDDRNGWGRERDENLDGRIFTKEEFESNLWYFIPYLYIGCDEHYLYHPLGEINKKHINAEYLEVTEDTSIVSERLLFTIELEVKHADETVKPNIKIPVYLRTRNSYNTFKNE